MPSGSAAEALALDELLVDELDEEADPVVEVDEEDGAGDELEVEVDVDDGASVEVDDEVLDGVDDGALVVVEDGELVEDVDESLVDVDDGVLVEDDDGALVDVEESLEDVDVTELEVESVPEEDEDVGLETGATTVVGELVVTRRAP